MANFVSFIPTVTAVCLAFCTILQSSTGNSACDNPQCPPSLHNGHDGTLLPKYEVGQSYFYEYETESITQLINAQTEDQSKVNLKGHVILTPISECFFDLSVGALKAITWFRGTQANVNTKVEIPKSSIRFSYENGTIRQVCMEQGDTFWEGNIKKSIISLLQFTNNGRDDQDFKTTEIQNDISGSCPTEIEKLGNLYYKRKNLNKCTHREFGPSLLNGVPYENYGSKYTGIPLLDSKLTCRQEVHSDVIQTSVCSEENTLKSLTGGGYTEDPQTSPPNIKSTLKSSLSLISIRSDTADASPVVQGPEAIQILPPQKPQTFAPSPIYFQAGYQEVDGTTTGTGNEERDREIENELKSENLKKLTHLLNQLCLEFIAEELSKEAPDYFQRLQAVFLTSSKDTLKQTYEDITAGHLCAEKRGKIERVFLKTAAQSSSDGSVGFLSELFTAGDLDDEISALFFKYVSFSRQPGRASLRALNGLVIGLAEISNSDLKSNILLSASALGHQYCKLTSANGNCGTVQEYIDLVDSIARLTLRRCENFTPGNPKETVLALQSLGNLDLLTPTAVDAIGKCLNVKSNRIRIHSFAAFRRDACQPVLKNKAKALLLNLRAGSDVRIHAYLALLRCFTSEDLETIQGVVDREQSNQVSSFIISHLKSQLDSSSRGKQDLKGLLRKIHVGKPTHSTFGKLSKSAETSWFLPENNVGLSMENNLAYSQDSYVPRTLSLNCTLDFLGRSYNVFEVGVYAENFENLLTRFYTEKVRFKTTEDDNEEGESVNGAGAARDINLDYGGDSDNEISKAQNGSEISSELNKNSGSKVKPIIDPADIEFIENQVQLGNRYGADGEFDIFTRHYGTTVSIVSIKQSDIPSLGEIPGILMAQKEKLMDLFKNTIIEKTRPIHFLDEHVIIATSNGLPLNLKLQSSAIFSSKYEINIDIPALFSNDKNGGSFENMHLKLMPNIAATINARMSVGPKLFEAGFQLEGKLHLSASADFSLKKSGGNLNINYNFPLNRFRVFEFDTQLVWVQEKMGIVTKRVEIASKNPAEMVVNECSTDSSRIFGFLSPHQFGVRYCYSVKLPRGIAFNNLLLQGPMSFRISSEKLDETMRGFSFDIHNVQDEENFRKSATVIVLDASGEDTNRKITIVGNFTEVDAAPGVNNLEQVSLHVEFPEAPLKVVAQIHDGDIEDDNSFTTIQGITATVTLEDQGSLSESEYQFILKTTPGFSEDEPEIIYEPVISKMSLHSDLPRKYFLRGKINRYVGSSIDFDVSLDLENKALILNSLDTKGFIKANRTTGGNFEFFLKNGTILATTFNPLDDSTSSYTARFDGRFFNQNPEMGFEIDALFSKNKNKYLKNDDLDFKILSKTSFIPSKKLSFETTTESVKQPALSTHFTFVTELSSNLKSGGEIESTILLSSQLKNWWDVQALRKAGSTYGSLELTLDIAALKRKLVLYTHRDHVDLEKFTKFDFSAFFKWNAGRDDRMKMAVELGFMKNDTEASSFIEFTKQIIFIDQKHTLQLHAKTPKNYRNGEYLIEGAYTSPYGSNYGINYKKLIANPEGSSSMSSEIQIGVNFPPFPEVKVEWKKSLLTDASGAVWYRDFNFKNDLCVLAGNDKFFEFIFDARVSGGNLDNGDFTIRNEFKIGGQYVPINLHVINRFDRFANQTLELEIKLVKGVRVNSEGQGSTRAGEKGGHLVFQFRPELLASTNEMLYNVDFSWEPTLSEGGNYYFLVPVKLSYSATQNIKSLLNFKIKNHAVLTLPFGQTTWTKNVEFANNALSLETLLQTTNPSSVLSLNLNGALRKDNVATVKLSTHTPLLDIKDIHVNVKMDGRHPQNYLNASVEWNDGAFLTIDHQLLRAAPKTVTTETVIHGNFFKEVPSMQVKLINLVTWSQYKTTFDLQYNLMGTKFRAKAGLIKPKDPSNNSEKWLVTLGSELQNLYKIRFEGPISFDSKDSSFHGSLLLEAVSEIDGGKKHQYIVDLDGSLTSNLGLGNHLYLNTTRLNGEVLHLKPDQFQELLEANVIVTETIIESLKSQGQGQGQSGSNLVKYDFDSMETSEGSEKYYRLQIEPYSRTMLPPLDINVHYTTENFVVRRLLLLTFWDQEVINGLNWVNTRSSGQIFRSLCHIQEPTEIPSAIYGLLLKDYETCSTGFSFNRTTDTTGGHGVQNLLKFSIADRIAFQTLKVERPNSIEFNSSFWLDALSKPNEELQIDLIRTTTVASEKNSVNTENGRQYSLVVKHPFLPRDLHVQTKVQREEKKRFLNVAVDLDIFKEEGHALAFNFQRKPKHVEERSEDEFEFGGEFYVVGGDDDTEVADFTSGITSVAKATGSSVFEMSLKSKDLNINFNVEGNVDLSDISYAFLDRNGVFNVGKIIFRVPSLLDSTVAQVGELPFLTVSFGGVPRLELKSPNSNSNSENTLIMEYHGSPYTLRIFSGQSPENSYYSIVIPPRNEDAFTIGLFSQNSPHNNYLSQLTQTGQDQSDPEEISSTPIATLDLALNTSNLLQIRSEWDREQIQYTLLDLRSLRRSISTGVKTYISSTARETSANLKDWNSRVYSALPEIQKFLEKLDAEINRIGDEPMAQLILMDIRHYMEMMGIASAHADGSTVQVKKAEFSAIFQNLRARISSVFDFGENGLGLSWDEIESILDEKFEKMQNEGLSYFVLSVGKFKKYLVDAKTFLQEYLEAHPGLESLIQTVEEIVMAGKTITQNLVRNILHRTIALRPFLRWLIPKEAHEFLITLKNYSLDKLQTDNHIIIQNSIEITNVTSDQVLSKGLGAAKKIGKLLLENKGFLYHKQNNSLLVQFPLPEPARTIRQVFSKPEKFTSADLRDLHNVYKWIIDFDFKFPPTPNILQGINSALSGAVGLVGSTGMIIGGKYYVTFDGKMHRFEGTCQYLLAADFFGRNLTVAIDTVEEGNSNSNSAPRIILVHNGETIAILPNTTVEYEGHREKVSVVQDFAEFETTNLGPFRTYRHNFPLMGDAVSVFTRNSGVTITCLSTFPLCFVRLDGHLYGKSLGLLGTNNLEHYDDFSGPTGEIVGKTGRFYRSWRLNRQCKETKGSVLVPEASQEIKERCAGLFQKDTSPLRSCFNVVNPADFQESCEALALPSVIENNPSAVTDTDEENVTKGICTVAAAYYMQCREFWIKVDFPQQCRQLPAIVPI